MAANGYSRLNPPVAKIPSVGQLINKGGTSIGAAGKVTDNGTVMRQGKQKNGGGKIPSIQGTLRQGGK